MFAQDWSQYVLRSLLVPPELHEVGCELLRRMVWTVGLVNKRYIGGLYDSCIMYVVHVWRQAHSHIYAIEMNATLTEL